MQLTTPLVAKAAMLIRRPPSAVYEAFVDPDITSNFWFTKGSALKLRFPQARVFELDAEKLDAHPLVNVAAVGAIICGLGFVKVLQALRRVGLVVATTLVTEVGDFGRFRTPKHLMGWIRLVPSSGTRTRRGAITKTGNSEARHAG